MSAAVPAVFEAVKVDYAAIAPMLVVVGGALIGVLVEAVAPRSTRYGAQLVLTLATIAAALVALFVWAVPHKAVTLGQSLAIDGPALFLQATLLVFGLLGVLAMSERFGGKSADAFTPMGASSPGSPQEAAATRAGFATSRCSRWRSSRSSGCSSSSPRTTSSRCSWPSKFSHCRSTSSPAWLAVVACCRRRRR